jgi:hypothetical protein
MNDKQRQPKAFVIEKPDAEEEAPPRKPRAITGITFEPEIDEGELIVMPPAPLAKPRRFRWGALLMGALFLLVSMWAGLAVTQLVTEVIGDKRPARLTRPQARDLALLAACYDQSTAESFPSRWSRLRRRVGYRAWLGSWPGARGRGSPAAVSPGLAAERAMAPITDSISSRGRPPARSNVGVSPARDRMADSTPSLRESNAPLILLPSRSVAAASMRSANSAEASANEACP